MWKKGTWRSVVRVQLFSKSDTMHYWLLWLHVSYVAMQKWPSVTMAFYPSVICSTEPAPFVESCNMDRMPSISCSSTLTRTIQCSVVNSSSSFSPRLTACVMHDGREELYRRGWTVGMGWVREGSGWRSLHHKFLYVWPERSQSTTYIMYLDNKRLGALRADNK